MASGGMQSIRELDESIENLFLSVLQYDSSTPPSSTDVVCYSTLGNSLTPVKSPATQVKSAKKKKYGRVLLSSLAYILRLSVSDSSTGNPVGNGAVVDVVMNAVNGEDTPSDAGEDKTDDSMEDGT